MPRGWSYSFFRPGPQLNDQGKITKPLLSQPTAQDTEGTLSDKETKVDYDRARQFVDYYTRKFGFGREDIEYNTVTGPDQRRGDVWEAVMTIGGSRISSGRGSAKKLAQKACYVDAAVYLETHDPALWRTFVEPSKTGRDLGMAPPVYCTMSESLEDEIYELCMNMKKSTLYKNALKLRPEAIVPPTAERAATAIKDLAMFRALDEQKNVTPLGKVSLQLPVEVPVGRLVLMGAFFKCLDNALTLAAILTSRDPFVSQMHLAQETAVVKNSWTHPNFRSDALAVFKAYNAWWEMQGRGDYAAANRFCSKNFLEKQTLLMVQKTRAHLLQNLYDAGVIDILMGRGGEAWMGRTREVIVPPELDINHKSTPLLVALLAVASQPNFAVRTGEISYRTSQDKVS